MPCGLVSEVHSVFLWAVKLQSWECRRTPSATEQKKNNIRFSEFWRVFLWIFLLFSRQVSLLFDLYILFKVGRGFKLFCSYVLEAFRFRFPLSVEFGKKVVACQRLPSPSTTTRPAFGVTKSPSWGLPAFMRPSPIWRVLNKLRCERLPSI